MSVELNANLSSSYVKPTIAVAIDTNAPAGGDDSVASRVLLFTEQLSAGTAVINTVSTLSSVADAINFYGTKSSAVRQLRHALAQTNVNGAVQFYGVGIVEPVAGVSGTGQIVVTIPGGSNPSSAGGCNVTMGGSEVASVSWTTSSTATTIGDSLVAALNLMGYEPWGTWSNAAGVCTATANAKGAFIEDHSVRVNYTTQGGVYLGPGTLTLSGNPSGSDGSLAVTSGTVTVTTSIPAATASAHAAALLVVTAINAADYPLSAGAPGGADGIIPIYFAAGKDCRRPSAALTTVGTITCQFQGGIAKAAAAGNSYAGTLGTGYPTMTTAIANVHATSSYGKWVGPWFDATTAGTMFASISTDGNGAPNQNRGQSLTLCSTGTEAAALTLIGATSPAMNANASNNNNGMRGAVCVSPDAPMPGYVYAAKVAAMRAASDPFTNYDGTALTGTSTAPMLLPSSMAITNYSDSSQNTTITDGLTPLAVKDGSLCVIFGRTTLATSDHDLWDWSWIDQADNHRADVRSQAAANFANCALISDTTTPRSRKDVNPKAFKSFLKAMTRRWEAQGTYNGADALADQCDAAINASNHSRLDAVYPESPKIPLHQIGMVALRSSPPLT